VAADAASLRRLFRALLCEAFELLEVRLVFKTSQLVVRCSLQKHLAVFNQVQWCSLCKCHRELPESCPLFASRLDDANARRALRVGDNVISLLGEAAAEPEIVSFDVIQRVDLLQIDESLFFGEVRVQAQLASAFSPKPVL
jgi:hypothetical protein